MLRPNHRIKLDDSDDTLFYSFPRFVTHVDDGFIQQLTDLYRDRLKPQTRIFDMMSSWVSHLPEEMEFAHVEGHGLNEEELAKNPQLNHYFVQNLNQNPKLPLPDQDLMPFSTASQCSICNTQRRYLPEIYRILKPGGIAIISFSNRMFYQKAIEVWRDSSEASRVELVKSYFQSVAGFSPPEVIAQTSSAPNFLQWLGVPGGDPFYAAIAYR